MPLIMRLTTSAITVRNTERRAEMKVCERCLWAIESREGSQMSIKHWIDDEEEVVCEWCEDVIENDHYFEI
jgi:hypothetical protein